MTATEIAHRLAGRSEEFCRWLFPQGKRSGRDWCVGSIAGEPGNSLKICLDGAKSGRWADFGGAQDEKGDLVGLLKRARGCELKTACDEALEWLGVPPEQRHSPAHPPFRPKIIETRAPSDTWLRLQRTLRPGTITEITQLAEQRRIPGIAGLELATRAGHLWWAEVWDDDFEWPAWILTDGARRNAQARRVDGKPWSGIGGKKAKTIMGCEAGWPVGIAEAGPKTDIFMVEGGPDLLAAWHLIWLIEKISTTTPVAMFGVANSIHPDALPIFASKTVRIFPHNDPDMKGMNGAIRWRSQLIDAGARAVDFFDFRPEGNKDLNDMVTQCGVPELREVV